MLGVPQAGFRRLVTLLEAFPRKLPYRLQHPVTQEGRLCLPTPPPPAICPPEKSEVQDRPLRLPAPCITASAASKVPNLPRTPRTTDSLVAPARRASRSSTRDAALSVCWRAGGGLPWSEARESSKLL